MESSSNGNFIHGQNNFKGMSKQSSIIVSVVIPVFNAEKFLAQSIESVIRQEYRDWELIIVDDGSTDDSAVVALKYVDNYPGKIFYERHAGNANKGAAASRNLGIEKSKGVYIAFLDADDVWKPSKLKTQVELFHQHPQATMLCEASDYWYSWNDKSRPDITVPVGAEGDQLYFPPQLLFKLYPLASGAAPCPSSIIMKRETIKALGGFEECFVGKIQAYEDQAFLSKVYLNEPVYISSESNNLYRQWKGSVMDIMLSRGYYSEARLFYFNWLKEYLHKKNVKDKRIRWLLLKAILPHRFPTVYKIFRKGSSTGKRLLKKLVGK